MAGRCERCFGSLPFTLLLLVSVKGAPVRDVVALVCVYDLSVPPASGPGLWATMDGLSPWKWSRLICAARDSYFLTGDSTGLRPGYGVCPLHPALCLDAKCVICGRRRYNRRVAPRLLGFACPSGLFGSPWTLPLDFGVHDSQETRCGGCPLSDGTRTAAGALVLGSTRLSWVALGADPLSLLLSR